MATKRKPAVKEAARRPAPKRPAQRKPSSKTPAKGKLSVRKRASRGAIETLSGKALRLAGVGTDAVARATGKAWDQWLALLDKAGAVAMPHKAIASMLANKFGVPSWWSQMVAVGYEQARGLRKVHEHSDGYAANSSRTIRAPLERLYGAWADPKLRALWLGPAPITVKRSTDGKSMRITWTAGNSSVDVNFSAAGDGRSRVHVEHGMLADEKARDEQKSFWGDALDRLKAMLEKAA
ncbi:MAG TPA: hypothetical protein VFV55_10935 [Usitatibacteraceae bacterium]|nr:hypothetical protein [Usitatibacteraceae bacterium]